VARFDTIKDFCVDSCAEASVHVRRGGVAQQAQVMHQGHLGSTCPEGSSSERALSWELAAARPVTESRDLRLINRWRYHGTHV
jgi:hypothetical protein